MIFASLTLQKFIFRFADNLLVTVIKISSLTQQKIEWLASVHGLSLAMLDLLDFQIA